MTRAVLILLLSCLPLIATAQPHTAPLEELFDRLSRADAENWQAIEAELERSLSQSGSPAMDLLLQRGRRALAEERPGAALAPLSALTDHAPEFAEGWYARATALFLTGRIGPALADLHRCLMLEPRHPSAITGLAVILEETGQPGKALEVYRRVLAIHPHAPDVKEAVVRLEAQLATDI